jgi:DNA repair protein RecO (recombination protein O)
MDERAHGVILRVGPLTESSLIVRWITRERGRISTVAKGAKRPKSSFAGKLDLYFQAELSYQRSQRSDLHTLREVVLLDTHAALRKELGWLQQGAYAAALLELATEPEAAVPELYDLWVDFLGQLAARPPEPMTIFGWEMKLLAFSGFQPDLTQAPLSPGARLVLEQCVKASWELLHRLRMSPEQTGEIQRFLRGWIQDGLGRVPRQREDALTAK